MGNVKKLSRVKKKETLTKEDIKKALKDRSIDKFDAMLNNELYAFRVKKALYEDGSLSRKGFLFNENIYNLDLGKKDSKGNILIKDSIIAIFNRYLMAMEFLENDEVISAFLIDTSNKFYDVISDYTSKKDKVSEQEYVVVYNEAYTEVVNNLTSIEISQYLDSKPELMHELSHQTGSN